MALARVRVELRQDKNGFENKDAFKSMLRAFMKASNEVQTVYKKKSVYESKSRKRRRKKREAELALLKQKLKENFVKTGTK